MYKILLTVFSVLLLLSVNVFAAQVSTPNLNADAGATVDIPVNVDNATGIAGFQFTITYNPTVLNCTNAIAGSLTAGWSILANPTSGQIKVGGFNFTTELGAVSGSLAILQCTAQNPGSTNVEFAASFLSNLNSEEVSHTTDNGTLTVTGGCAPTGPDTDCNGVDEDCDGTPDDGYVPTPTSCGVGICASTGQATCVSGNMVDTCQPGTPQTEGPNGSPTCSDVLDNDCDGAADSADSDCASTCTPTGPDTNCNGADEDCDGTPDNHYVPTPISCGVGICAATGELLCQSGSHVDTCTPGTPQTEGPLGNATCSDLSDNDCDGFTDNADPGCVQPPVSKCFDNIDNDHDGKTDCEEPHCDGKTDGACDTGKLGVCATGTYTCEGGAKVCKQNTRSTAETIAAGNCSDGIDNDCDGDVDAADSDCTSGELIHANVDFAPSILNVKNHNKIKGVCT